MKVAVFGIGFRQVMREEIQGLIDNFKSSRWKSDPYSLTYALIDTHSPHIATLLEMTLEQLADAGTFFQDAISFAPQEELPRLAGLAVNMLRSGGESRTAEEFISQCSLQCVEALHPMLDDIRDLRPNWSTYYAHWPWRGSGKLQFSELARLAHSGTEEALPAWRMLLEKRHPMILEYCADNTARIERAIGKAPSNIAHEFFEVGFDLKQGKARQLYSNEVSHLVFPQDYWSAESAAHLVKRHPTWRASDGGPSKTYRFGGWGAHQCPSCGERGHSLISFPEVPSELPVTGLAAVVFETCLTCINAFVGPLFYQHSDEGVLRRITPEGPRTSPEFTCDVLLETNVELALTPSRWRWQSWGHSNGRQNLSRIGGHPCWIQSAEYLNCPLCSETMHALFQLDSNLLATTAEGMLTEVLWGSGGICYVQWCDHCKVSGQLIQCT